LIADLYFYAEIADASVGGGSNPYRTTNPIHTAGFSLASELADANVGGGSEPPPYEKNSIRKNIVRLGFRPAAELADANIGGGSEPPPYE